MDMSTPFASHNVEQLNYQLLQHTLRPWIKKLENQFNKKLFTEEEQGEYFVRFDVSEYHKADVETTQTVSASQLQNGQISVNEWRTQNGMNSIGPKGDVYRVQLNMANAEPDEDQPDSSDDDAEVNDVSDE